MISIRPKWCELISNGKKTLEIRKTRPKIDTPFKCYIYCTNSGRPLVWGSPVPYYTDEKLTQTYGYSREDAEKIFGCWNGKVIGEFVVDFIVDMSIKYSDPDNRLSKREFPYTCMTDKEIIDYLGNGGKGYAWHISELKIYDEPKELEKFGKFECEYCSSEKECFAPESIYYCSLQRANTNPNQETMWICDCDFIPLTRPPQSWCYVDELR